LTWKDYWSHWLPNRLNYAFPLRDVTIFFDVSLKNVLGNSTFWISNFIYFLCGQLFFISIIRRRFNRHHFMMLFAIVFLLFHPLQIELIQWVTCRKYLVGFIPIALGTYLFDKWMDKPITHRKLLMFFALWLMSLAAYPTAVFWIFWILWGYYARDSNKNKIKLYATIGGLVSFGYLAVVGDATPELNAAIKQITFGEKSFFFAYNALGRGIFNFIFPFKLAAFYDEHNPINRVGLAIFAGIILGLIILFQLVKKNQNLKKEFITGIYWIAGGSLFLIPIANTILSFPDFMLADRHFYMSLPFFIIGICHFIQAIPDGKKIRHDQPKAWNSPKKAAVFMGLSIWIIAAILVSYQRVPLWRDAFQLMNDCSAREQAPKCYSQAIRNKFFQNNCLAVETLIKNAAVKYRDVKFSQEFKVEIPFFHSTCIAFQFDKKPSQKAYEIDRLQTFYGDSPEVIFALTLTLLEEGNRDGAFKMASQYYFGKLDLGPIQATQTITGIYAGQISALCELAPSSECSNKIQHFLNLHPTVSHQQAAVNWGYKITTSMAIRGKLKTYSSIKTR